MVFGRYLLPLLALALCGGNDVPQAGQPSALPLPVVVGAPTPTGSVTFLTTDADFPNPERGFYHPVDSDLAHLKTADVDAAFAAGDRLLYAQIDLEPYRNTALPADFLDKLDSAFAKARGRGMKLIIRAVYNDPQGETGYQTAQDAPLSRVVSHLAQLKPIFSRNVNVIAFVQAGFVGAWGEWHTSSNALTEPDARTRIKDALLDAVPADRFVQFRYPPYMIDWVPNLPTVARTLAGSFRMGVHNDCFLASRTDVGTFDEDPGKRASQQDYVDRLGDVAPFGGETCNPADESGATSRGGCDAIKAEGKRFNLTYLNISYYRALFHERWIRERCMAEVRRNMGYRIMLLDASHAVAGARGKRARVTITVRNSGWARIYNPRPVEIILRNQATSEVNRIRADGADPRGWVPGADITVRLQVALPASLATGRYDVLFALPDADPRLARDGRYAIRVANADDPRKRQRWVPQLGAFDLGTTLTVN
jgi:Domain of unknown function (DUF4832)/Domain of unknown function (DUF4874)